MEHEIKQRPPLEGDAYFMSLAIAQAKKAAALDEAPIGALVVRNGAVIAAAYNRRERDKRAVAHAELLAIDEACRVLGGWRLQECDLFVTLEPCPMCAGAIINARIHRVVFGAFDKKAGCAGSVCDLFSMPFNHRPEVTGGVCGAECGALLTAFFKAKRLLRE